MDSEPLTRRKPGRRRVLLVDDHEALLETTAALLEDDYQVYEARNGEQALNLLSGTRVDIVCADFQMPGLDGVELLRRVHMMSPGVPGVLVTGIRDQLPKGIAGDEAIFAVIYKPFTLESLLAVIQSALRVTNMTSAVENFRNSSDRLNRERTGGR